MWRGFVFWWGNVRRQWRYYGSPRVSYVRGVPRRVLAGGYLPPRLVDRYLLRTEVIVRAMRLHPWPLSSRRCGSWSASSWRAS
jgi:hypothetical protein